jgi:type IV pilus secretin PilQ/predicted competence protein
MNVSLRGQRRFLLALTAAFPLLLETAAALGQANISTPPPAEPPVGIDNSTGVLPPPSADSNSVPKDAAQPAGPELINLEYRNAPFVEVIRTLAEGANINITMSADVEKGSPVTIRLNKVTYEQALKAILETYKFGSVVENGILKIDTLANLNLLRDEKIKFKEAAWKLQPTKRMVWQVNYAKATELTGLLGTMLKGYTIDPRFSIVADKRTNKVIIEGIADALVEAKALLENLDRRKQQVLIEARIVEASNELSKTLSVTWGTRFGFDGNRGLANGLIFPNSLSGSLGGAGALGASAPAPGLATSPTQLGTLQFTVGSINNLVNIDAVLRAYETESLANVIASPRVVVQDQEKATIKEDVTLSRSVLGPDGKPEGRNTIAALELKVAPQITSENTLELDIDVTRQTPTNAPTDPVQGSIKRQANTKLIVNNGETAVIGGLYQTQKFRGQGRIPFLGRLPIIGMLFRTNEEQSFRSELMVLITPRILPGGSGRSSARTDLPILEGSSSGTGGSNNFNNDGGNNFSNGSGSQADQSSSQSSGNGAAAPQTGGATSASSGAGAAGGNNNLGNGDDFGLNDGGSGAPSNAPSVNAKSGNEGLNNLGNNVTSGNAGKTAGAGNNPNNLGNLNNLGTNSGGATNTAKNSGGGEADDDFSNTGGGEPAQDQGTSGGGDNLNNLGGDDL